MDAFLEEIDEAIGRIEAGSLTGDQMLDLAEELEDAGWGTDTLAELWLAIVRTCKLTNEQMYDVARSEVDASVVRAILKIGAFTGDELMTIAYACSEYDDTAGVIVDIVQDKDLTFKERLSIVRNTHCTLADDPWAAVLSTAPTVDDLFDVLFQEDYDFSLTKIALQRAYDLGKASAAC